MLKDRNVTVRELCEIIPDVTRLCIDKILTDHLGYAKVYKEGGLQAYETDDEELVDSIVTGDEAWPH
ncbi:hypothetical protein Trydic_g21691 [Trypoxylus dichotomus]